MAVTFCAAVDIFWCKSINWQQHAWKMDWSKNAKQKRGETLRTLTSNCQQHIFSTVAIRLSVRYFLWHNSCPTMWHRSFNL